MGRKRKVNRQEDPYSISPIQKRHTNSSKSLFDLLNLKQEAKQNVTSRNLVPTNRPAGKQVMK